ncbi:MAG: metalloregulator ArsR/SmtB family transcription factor [Chloroflexota bacterium]
MEEQDAVFRALADPNRRQLLDRLRERDGQALGELATVLPDMTRFGVMKHLRVLEDAGLVTTRRDGRQKLHFLNPVPIRLISDRWISRYAAPFISAMADLKSTLEAEQPMSATKQVYEIFIRASAERVWQGIADGNLTKQYYYGSELRSNLAVGGDFNYVDHDGGPMIDGRVLESDPPRRLVTTFAAVWDPATANDRPSRVTYELEPMGEVTKLTLIHDDFDGETETYRQVAGGWSLILSGLKSLLETGEPLPSPQPAQEPAAVS